jgi:metallo-beta-lactamase class B
VFDVMSGGQTHRAMLWGGTAFNFGENVPRLSNHASYDALFAKLAALRQQPGLQPNPFVIGNAAVTRALTVMDECAQAARDHFMLQ